MLSLQCPTIAVAMRSHGVDQGDHVGRRVTLAQDLAHARRKRHTVDQYLLVLAGDSRHRRLVMSGRESVGLQWHTFEESRTASQGEGTQETNGCGSCSTNVSTFGRFWCRRAHDHMTRKRVIAIPSRSAVFTPSFGREPIHPRL